MTAMAPASRRRGLWRRFGRDLKAAADGLTRKHLTIRSRWTTGLSPVPDRLVLEQQAIVP